MIFYKDRFRSLRESRGLTLDDVAVACNVSKQTVQKWEKHVTLKPRPSKIDKIAHVLNCDVSDLCNLHDQIPMDGPVYLDERLNYIVDRWDSLTHSQQDEILEVCKALVFINETKAGRGK